MTQELLAFRQTPNQVPAAIVELRHREGREVLGPVVLSQRGIELISQRKLTIGQAQRVLRAARGYFQTRCPELVPHQVSLNWIGGTEDSINVQLDHQLQSRALTCSTPALAPRNKEVTMNQDILQGKWTQLKGEVQAQWGKLTHDDIAQIEGDSQKLVGLLQERYGYAREEATRLLDEFQKKART